MASDAAYWTCLSDSSGVSQSLQVVLLHLSRQAPSNCLVRPLSDTPFLFQVTPKETTTNRLKMVMETESNYCPAILTNNFLPYFKVPGKYPQVYHALRVDIQLPSEAIHVAIDPHATLENAALTDDHNTILD